ncbi:YheT family hydrolase [Stenoxybacter acetivorans]|uniref:YheT family hydrolase n=1 Tax=Stenoxybacter acetivorans TaxID=422441 RepID=UPI00068F4653|nr:alpha/beta fold hydrolase [Stenoxybacter acetivorans]
MPSDCPHKALLNTLPRYQSPAWLCGAHAQTIWAKAVAEPIPPYRRSLHADSTGLTQTAYDHIDSSNQTAPLVVLFHGLEGSSRSHYARALMNTVAKYGWQGCVAHFRGCGGVPNTAPVAYHCGDSNEIAHILRTVHDLYPQRSLFAVGVSLGGNALAKYLAENGENALCCAAAVVSAPIDLPAGSIALERGLNRRIYAPYFLKTLLPKVQAEIGSYPDVDLAAVLKSCSLGDFDDTFTAPVHGFANKYDYYRRSAAKPLLPEIKTPTLLINAKNDPFLPAEALPSKHDVSAAVYLLQPKHGGHAGFVSGSGRGHIRWLPETVLRFFKYQL